MDWARHIRRILVRQGEDVTITVGTGAPATVRGLYLEPYQVAELGLPGVASSNPHFVAMSGDITNIARNDSLVRGAVTYRVKVKKPDDPGGFTLLELTRQ